MQKRVRVRAFLSYCARVILVVPCYNEESRLSQERIDELLADESVELVLVDDGSTDGTRALLHRIAAQHPARVRALCLTPNAGKAEAVRRGLLSALETVRDRTSIDDIVGYADADFATPPQELLRLRDELRASGAKVVLGARIARLGAQVERKPMRHYLGRLFATTASLVLALDVYDTQCGAKLFVDTPALRAALAQPFSSRWVFDVELLGRLTTGTGHSPPLRSDAFIEVPLRRWEDVRGSKLGVGGGLRGGVELLRLAARVRQRGRRGFFPG